MRRLVFAALALCAPSLAQADGPYGASARPFSWTGYYFGVNGGYAWNDKGVAWTGDGQGGGGTKFVNLAFTGDLTSDVNTYNQGNPHNGLAGAQFGYNRQVAKRWVIGYEADIQSGLKTNASTSATHDF